jgi:hypothetical protein
MMVFCERKEERKTESVVATEKTHEKQKDRLERLQTNWKTNLVQSYGSDEKCIEYLKENKRFRDI